MQMLAPVGPVYQAGTLSGNPLAMAAGLATVGNLIEHCAEVYPQLEKTSAAVTGGVTQIARECGVSLTTNRVGSMFTFFFSAEPVTDYASAALSDTERFAAFHRAMLDAGVWLPPSQFEAAFVSTSHSETDIRATLAAAREAMATLVEATGR